MSDKIENVIIIGSGPAGLTAGIYAARANLKPLMVEGYQAGGQLMITSDVENFPGFENPVTGPELMEAMKKQALRLELRIISKDVTKVDLKQKPFRVWVGNEEYKTHSVIISTGASAKWLGMPSEKKLMGKGVSACATCDGAFFKKQDVVVVGGGDTAMEEASFLTRFANQVYLIHRSDSFRASKIMLDRVKNNPKIKMLTNTTTVDILGETGVEAVRIKNVKTNETQDLKATGFFVAIGHSPNTELFKGQLDLDQTGYILTKPGTTQTNIPGVFASGDVQDKIYRQAVTAAGTGCMAALESERWLEAQGHH